MSLLLLVIGAGAQARYILETIQHIEGLDPLGLIDTHENEGIWGSTVDGVRVLGGIDALKDYPPAKDLRVICAIADRERKRSFATHLNKHGYQFRSVVHPKASIAHSAIIGQGCVINAGVTIETGARVGDHVIIHSGSVIEHDVEVQEFANIGPGVSTAGRVKIGAGANVYTGAIIIPGMEIGRDATVGAGSVVTEDVEDGATVVGAPAKPIAS